MAWWRKFISLRSKIYGEGSLDSLQAHKIFPIGAVQENQVQLLAEKNVSSPSASAVEDNKTETTAFPKKEKDWKMTLASRLLEESPRSSVYSGEGMDLLWERYEINDSIKNSSRREGGEPQSKKMMKKRSQKESDDDEEEQEVMIGQLCCLQALKKLSTGKGSFGMMGSSNLTKISKALKGFRWVRRVSKMVVHVEDRF